MNEHATHLGSTDLVTYRVETKAGDDRYAINTRRGKTEELMLEDGVCADGQQTLGALGGVGPQAPALTGGQDERVHADM